MLVSVGKPKRSLASAEYSGPSARVKVIATFLFSFFFLKPLIVPNRVVRCYPSVLPVVLGLIHNKPKKSIEKVATLFLYMAKETLSKKKNTNYQRKKNGRKRIKLALSSSTSHF